MSRSRYLTALVAYVSSQGVGPERAGDPYVGIRKRSYSELSKYQPSDTPRFEYLFIFLYFSLPKVLRFQGSPLALTRGHGREGELGTRYSIRIYAYTRSGL